jgi:glutathione S-transferase
MAMITLYRTAEDATGRELQQALEESSLAHDVVLVSAAGPGREGLPAGARPPVLVDDGRVYQDKAAILARLGELTALRELWHKYGSDACYCDEDGNVL